MIQHPSSSERCTIAAFPLCVKQQKWGVARGAIPKGETRFKLTFIRQWREHKGLSLDALASRVPMDKGNLSKVERGLLPYNQEMLERLAEALGTEPASLLMRDPSDPEGIWSIWDRAQPSQKRQLAEVAAALIRTGTDG